MWKLKYLVKPSFVAMMMIFFPYFVLAFWGDDIRCGSIAECRRKAMQFPSVEPKVDEIKKLMESRTQIGDYVRDDFGDIVVGLTQEKAQEACEKRRMRLPTIQELALEALDHNAAYLARTNENLLINWWGILFPGQVEDYYAVDPEEGEAFYYSHENYSRETDLGTAYRLWSQSLSSSSRAFVFNARYGKISSVYVSAKTQRYTARCVALED